MAGIGGLGHLAVQLAKARGADKVVAFTTTPAKADDVRRLGADDVVVMSDADAVAAHVGTIDFLLSTIPTPLDLRPYVGLLKHDATLVSVGLLAPSPEEAIDFTFLTLSRTRIAGSLIGSIAETQEVLDFCAEHGIAAAVEVIPAERINAAFDEVVAKEARFRYVIDTSTLPAPSRSS